MNNQKKKNYKVGYQMSRQMFEALLKTRRDEDEKKMNPYTYVLNIINSEFGLKNEVNHIAMI